MSYLALKKVYAMMLLEMKFSKKAVGDKYGYAKAFNVGVKVPHFSSKRCALKE